MRPMQISADNPSSRSMQAGSDTSTVHPRRPKRSVPEHEKDARYYENRRMNNEASKRSREARKQRELDDRLALLARVEQQRKEIKEWRDKYEQLRQLTGWSDE